MRMNRRWLGRIVLALILVLTLMSVAFAAGEGGSRPTVECSACQGYGICMECYGTDPACAVCEGTNVCATCGGEGVVPAASNFYATAFALLPPVIAIALALITKEVYSSLFIGILVGGLLYSNFSFEGTVLHVFEDGIASVLSDSYNVGILIFLVILGSMVCLMNKAGGSHYRQAQRLPREAGLPHRRHRCPRVYHRPHQLLGRRGLRLRGGRPGPGPVHQGHPL